ncbi:MAG: anthranilate synthase component I [Gammaproteobacteria bacterium]|nr:anthranilate synthase component I [Gammaproteobacteria bacterium]NND38229.1 anthranilate synthase component I [Pseudomonadales bacterium]MBT8152061.1 anthranilate synthase component I [Gammaproteobacteria bacterium]NNL11035.1 anthranilate synthase component I [Pseudomonadales bacterium]NNM12039.1 anthranilate synthase component I [Pseudomonadales bacterium]
MQLQEFCALAQQGYNRIPLTKVVLADLDTPVSAYAKLASGAHSFLFESVQGGEKWGRYSIIGLPCRTVLKAFDERVELRCDGELLEEHKLADPLEYVESFAARYRVPELAGMPAFFGGLVGYFSYDTVRYVEPRLQGSVPEDTLGAPDILLMLSEDVLVFDNLASKIHIVTHVDVSADAAEGELAELYQQANAQLDALAARLRNERAALSAIDVSTSATEDELAEGDFSSGFTQPEYEQVVEKIKQYTLAGDVMQVVPSQRMSAAFKAPPINLYRALRSLNPSPYMYFLDLGDFHVVGSSPEILARVEQGEITVRPIAGTRRRGYSEAEDRELERELLADPKELAEHLMLIDLGRNDAGRVSEIGSVKLTDKMLVERYSHVMHIVSNVTGKLREGLGPIDVLRATLPAGTLSGAPKIRAMEIIDEVEPVKRGVYGGAVGYLSWQGNMDTAIAIRTAVIKDDTIYVQAGGGVVADSVPRLEWEETMNKARAMFRAATIASRGGKR